MKHKNYKNVDFGNIEDIIQYAYGNSKEVKNRKGLLNVLQIAKSRISKEKRSEFRDKHECKLCYLFETGECKAEDYCRFDRHKHRRRSKKLPTCPLNNDKPCCYANEIGTCLGYCHKKIKSEILNKADRKGN